MFFHECLHKSSFIDLTFLIVLRHNNCHTNCHINPVNALHLIKFREKLNETWPILGYKYDLLLKFAN